MTECLATEASIFFFMMMIRLVITFYQGDSKRDFNPTCYRTDAQYSHLVQSVQAEEPKGGQKSGFDIVLKKKVKAYIEVQSCQPSETFSKT